MIQCKDCEFCTVHEDGKKSFTCDPFTNIKEPECLNKWQLIRLDMLVQAYSNMIRMQEKLAPMHQKIFKYVQREIDDIEEADSWKFDEYGPETGQDPENPDTNPYL